MRLTARQVRAARVLLGWSQDDLSSAAELGIATIRRLEAQDGVLRGMSDTIWKIQEALENAGIIFIDDNDSGGLGVRLSKRSSESR